MANGKGKTFKFGKMMVNVSGRGIATKDTETGEIRRHPFPWKQPKPVNPEPDYNPAEEYEDEYDPNQEYDEPGYEGEEGEYYDPEEGDYEEKPASILDSEWLMWAALILLPPLGIWLLWKNNRLDTFFRSAISAVAIIWFVVLLILIFSAMNRNNDPTLEPPVTPSHSAAPTETPEPTPTPSKTAIPAFTNTPEPSATPQPTAQNTGAVTPGATTLPEWVWSKQGGTYYHSVQDCTDMEGANRVLLSVAQNRRQTACPKCMAPETSVKPTQTPLPAGSYYSTPTGTWYHSDPNCQKMTAAQVVSQAEAIARNQTACPVCIGSVYMTEGGTWYHSISNCQKMTNAKLVTVDYAVSVGKTACPECMDGASTGNTGTTQTGNNNADGVYWYNPDGGTYYHKTSDCTGMKNAIQGSASAAENNGKLPCPTCLGGESANAKFYATANGTWYHTKSDCTGMRNATRMTEATAIARGKTACPTCAGGVATGGNRVEVNTGNTTGNNTTTVTQTTTKFYSTTDGENFHSNQTCRGMKNATEVSAAEIAKRGQTPCPKCIGTSGTYYSTVDGTYYHSKANCSGMKNATIVTLAMIKSRKQTACPECLNGKVDGTTYYWANANGSYYHSKSNCSGMKNAVKVTEDDAEDRGQTPCPTCVGSVYGTEDGTYFHKDKTCSGMKDAVHMTIQAAEKSGKTACPKCITGITPTPKPTATPKPGEDDADGSLYYYATDDGKYYHRESDCTGMRGAKKVSEKTATARGQKPCPECIGSVYATETGDHYHSDPECSGMRGAKLVTIDTAELRGQSPCPECLDGDGDAPVTGNTGNAGNTTGGNADDIMVYCTLTGRKYHSLQYCSGMAYAGEVPLSWALDPAYEPCTKCNAPKPGTVDEDETMVYCTLGGQLYHADEHCSGMRKAVDVPMSWALDPGFTPCRECNPPKP